MRPPTPTETLDQLFGSGQRCYVCDEEFWPLTRSSGSPLYDLSRRRLHYRALIEQFSQPRRYMEASIFCPSDIQYPPSCLSASISLSLVPHFQSHFCDQSFRILLETTLVPFRQCTAIQSNLNDFWAIPNACQKTAAFSPQRSLGPLWSDPPPNVSFRLDPDKPILLRRILHTFQSHCLFHHHSLNVLCSSMFESSIGFHLHPLICKPQRRPSEVCHISRAIYL